MKINLELYNIFYTVASYENITKASEILHISQPAITKQIKNLEDELGFELFIRTKRGVILTENGKQIYEQAKEIIKHAKNIENISKALTKLETGTLKIGTGKSLTKAFLMPILEEVHNLYPEVNVEISIGPTSELIKKLKDGKLDLLFTKTHIDDSQGLEFEKIGELHDVFICSKDYDNLLNHEVTLKEIAKYPIILPTDLSITRSSLNKYFANQNIKLESKMEVASLSLVANFTKIGYGVGIATKEYIEQELLNNDVFIIDIKPALNNIDYGITKLTGAIESPIAKEFCRLLKEKRQ